MADTDNPVLIDVEDGVGIITLNRPAQINAINDAIRTGVPAALAELDDNPDVSVILFRAAGERGFCVGADIKEFREKESAIDFRQRTKRMSWVEAFDDVTKPVIAAIQGFCFGGGLEASLACDIRMVAPNAIFGLPEVNLGLIPGGGGTQRLTRMVGLSRALDFLISGERFDAQRALDLGIVTRMSETPESLQAEALAFAKSIAEKPPTAVAFVKEAARDGFDMDLKSALNLERDLFSLLMDSDERREAAAAFKEKRKPKFR